jgi:parallel beta-helix repeat protein
VIQAALAGLTAGRTWQEKVVLKGNFVLSATIQLPSYTTLEIQGKLTLSNNVTFITNTDHVNGNSYIEIIGGIFYGTGGTETIYAVNFDHVSHSKVSNCIFKNIADHSVYCTYSSDNLFERSLFFGSGDTSLVLDYNSKYNRIIGNYMTESIEAGIYIRASGGYSSDYNLIESNTVYNNRGTVSNGIMLGSSYNTCVGNICYYNAAAGIKVTDGGHDNTVGNNVCYDNDLEGIRLDASSYDNVVEGNTVVGNGIEGTRSGISTDGSSKGVISSNLCKSNGLHGIYVAGGGFIVQNNLCETNKAAGIEVLSNNNTVSGNICKNNNQLNSYHRGIWIYNGNYNLVIGNRCFDDQASKTQKYGIYEEGTSNYNVIVFNDVRGNLTGGLSIVGANTIAEGNAGYNPQAASTPSVGASPVTFGPYPYPVMVIVYGGTVSDITVRGLSTGLTSGTFYLYPGDTIVITYTAAPTVKLYPQ